MTESRKRDAAAIALLALLLAVVFADVLGGACFFVRDLTRYYFPTKSILHRIVAGGELPLWNPYYSGGQPAAANPEYEVFYPGQWPIFLPDFYLGYRLHILLHLLLGAAGMYALMRSMNARVETSLATAIAFVFSGPFLSSINLLPILFALAWLPWTLLFIRGYCIERRARDLARAALCAGMAMLVFEPGTLLQMILIMAGYAIYKLRRRAMWVPLPLVAALAIAAVQVVPTLDFVRQTPRSRGMSFEMLSTWSMPPSRLMELAQPHWFGRNPFLSDQYTGASHYANGTPFYQSLYLGLTVLVLLITGLVRRHRPTIVAVMAACGVWIVCFGAHTPLLRLAYATGLPLPLRFPERFATAAAFVLLVASGLMLDRLFTDDQTRRTAAVVAIALACAAPAIPPALPLFIRAAVLALLLAFGHRLPRVLFAAALAAFVFFDLLPYVNEIAPRMPRQFFEPPPVAGTLPQPADNYRIFFQPEWSSGPMTRRYFGPGPEKYQVLRNGMFPRLTAAWRFSTIFERDIDLTNLQPSEDLTRAFNEARQSGRPDAIPTFASMANVDFMATYRPFDPTLREPIAFVRIGNHPRYYFASQWGAGALAGVKQTANHITLDVVAQSNALLVASVTRDRYWQATIDGKPTTIQPVNIAFMGIAVPPGAHRVELRYRNPLVTAGAIISILATLCAALTAFLPTARARRESIATS